MSCVHAGLSSSILIFKNRNSIQISSILYYCSREESTRGVLMFQILKENIEIRRAFGVKGRLVPLKMVPHQP